MRLSPARLFCRQKTVRLSATVTSPRLHSKFNLWIETSLSHRNLINHRSEVFLPAALLLAMSFNEDLLIDSPIRQDVLNSLNQVMALITSWPATDIWPKLHPIAIHAKIVNSVPKPPKNRGKAAFFSLGLDSFYGLKKSQETPQTRLSHLILVHGFDIALNNQALFTITKKNTQAVARATDKKLITVKTNLKIFLEQGIGWDAAHGAALASVAHFLSGGLKEVIINSGDIRSTTHPYGTRYDLDRLWSNRRLTISTSGVGLTRLKKVEYLLNYPLAQKYLRVCWKNPNNAYNCSHCPKCIGTMALLAIHHALPRFSTFKSHIQAKDMKTIVEPMHRIFWWNDAFLKLPLNYFSLRLQIIGIWIRSYTTFLKSFLSPKKNKQQN